MTATITDGAFLQNQNQDPNRYRSRDVEDELDVVSFLGEDLLTADVDEKCLHLSVEKAQEAQRQIELAWRGKEFSRVAIKERQRMLLRLPTQIKRMRRKLQGWERMLPVLQKLVPAGEQWLALEEEIQRVETLGAWGMICEEGAEIREIRLMKRRRL